MAISGLPSGLPAPLHDQETLVISPTGIPSAESHGTHTVEPGEVVISPTGITSDESLGTATVSPGEVVINPTGIPSAESFGTASITFRVRFSEIGTAEEKWDSDDPASKWSSEKSTDKWEAGDPLEKWSTTKSTSKWTTGRPQR